LRKGSILKVALTGGIATGKSIVGQVLESLGCYIHRADQVAHDLMNPGKPAWKRIVNHFGQEILKSDKTIDRTKLGEIIFSDPQKRDFLNGIVHPLVFQKKIEILKFLEKQNTHKIFISEAALTIESGFADFFDKIVITHCQPALQVKRLMERDQISQKEAKNKIGSQMRAEEKTGFADYIIDTSGTIQETIEQTERLFRNLVIDYDLLYGNEKN
jgi:dephospho-CoA kinase